MQGDDVKYHEPLPALLAAVRRLAHLHRPDGATQAPDATDLCEEDEEADGSPCGQLAAAFRDLKSRLLDSEVRCCRRGGSKAREGHGPLGQAAH